jgi:hypothetical protein
VGLIGTQNIGGNWHYLYHVKNNNTAKMTQFSIPNDTDTTSISSCGNSWANRQNIDSHYRGCAAQNSSQYLLKDGVVSWDIGANLGTASAQFVCTFDDASVAPAELRAGGSLNPLTINDQYGLDVPLTCDTLDLLCQAKQYIGYILIPNPKDFSDQLNQATISASQHLPVAYFYGISTSLSPFLSSYGSPSAIPAFNFGITPKLLTAGVWHDLDPVQASISGSVFSPIQSSVTIFRNFIRLVAYLSAIGGIFFLFKP